MKKLSFLWLSPTLTAIGKKLHIDAHYFAKNSFFVLVGQIVSVLRGIIAGYLVSRFFEKEVYGEYQFILSVLGMFSFFGLAGLATPVARAWSRGESFSINAVTRYQLMVASVGSLILLVSIFFLGFYGRQDSWPLFLAAAILLPVPSVAMTRFGSFTIGKGNFGLQLKANIVWSCLLIVATLLILVYAQSALLMFIAATAIPPLTYLWFKPKK
jgi:O-antigen/teichoic acid export membrane protein